MSDKIKLVMLAVCVLVTGHLEWQEEQDRIRFQKIEEAQQILDRNYNYWMPAPEGCDNCHTIRGTKGCIK